MIPVGIDAARFSPDGPALERTSRPRIVVAGRLVPRKGIGSAIEALAAVPEAELVIAGGPEPPLLDRDPLVTALRKRAEELGVLDRVIFLGRIPHAEMPALLRSADVFVSTPHYEPFGTVVLEAAACGVPVVATAVGGLPSHVLDGVTGVLIPRGDPVALSTALSELLTHPSRRAALGTAAALRAQRYSWPRVAAELLEVYHSLIG